MGVRFVRAIRFVIVVALVVPVSAAAQDSPSAIAPTWLRQVDLPAGCSELRLAFAASVGAVATVFRSDGERVAGPVRGIEDLGLAICVDRRAELIVRVDADRATPLAIEVAASSSSLRTVGAASSRTAGVWGRASASARVAAKVARLEFEGLRARGPVEVGSLPGETQLVPPRARVVGCTILLVAVDAGDVSIGGTSVRDGETRELVICGASEAPVPVRVLGGSPRLARAFVGEGLDPDAIPRARANAWAESRGFRTPTPLPFVREGSTIRATLSLAPGRCAAVLALGVSPGILSLVDAEGVVIASSTARDPAPRILRCAEGRPLELGVVVVELAPDAPVELLVAHEGPP